MSDDRESKAGYYSWVCFIDAQKGAWVGPFSKEEADQYAAGFSMDANIKSFTLFQFYSDKPTGTLECDF